MNDFDYDINDEMYELRRRVERKREVEATKKLTKSKSFDLYLEESGPIILEQELGYSINDKNWDE